MKYMGSKLRIAKHILPIILKDRKPNQWYVEPFVGGGNIIDKVERNRIGADIDVYAIEALRLIRDWPESLPKNNQEFTETDYKKMKKSDNIALKGYCGYALSFGAKWFGGWRRDKMNLDYVKCSFNSAIKQSPKLKGARLICDSYLDLRIPYNSIVYCDPPYKGTTKYKQNFNHDKFWEWAEIKTLQGYKVFISEYSAPDNFKCIWKKEIHSSLARCSGNKKATEKLFILK